MDLIPELTAQCEKSFRGAPRHLKAENPSSRDLLYKTPK
jgi:hypothetical protein